MYSWFNPPGAPPTWRARLWSVPDFIGASSSLRSRPAQTDAQLLVLGGFGHTRACEFVLGGVSRTVLESMTLPVLMSH